MRQMSAAVAIASLLAFTAPTFAQTQADAPKTPAAASTSGASVKQTKPQRTAKSLDCSKQADGKNMHGKERRTFMSACKKV